MIIENLASELINQLKNAKEVFIATALITQHGYEIIKKNLPVGCTITYLVGVDLPTCPETLTKLKEDIIANKTHNARIYRSNSTYHPKVYIFKSFDEQWCALVGSANTTSGGLSKNVEMSIKVKDPAQCFKLLKWFKKLYDTGITLDDEFIGLYKNVYSRIKSKQKSIQSDISSLPRYAGPKSRLPHHKLDGQFFTEIHFDAYNSHLWYDYSESANNKRRTVKDKLKVLHSLIYPYFEVNNLKELAPHHHTQNIVSNHCYKRNFTSKELRSIWLHYGYRKEDIPAGNKFIDLPRIQIILHNNDIGIWLVIGKNQGSISLRKNLKKKLNEDKIWRDDLYKDFVFLGSSYELCVSNSSKSVSEVNSANHLAELFQKDDPNNYLIVRRLYHIDDPELSANKIGETVLEEIKRLYPIFKRLKNLM